MKASSCSLNGLLSFLQTAKSHKAKHSPLANSTHCCTNASGTAYLERGWGDRGGGEKSLIYFPTHDAVSQNPELHLCAELEWAESDRVPGERSNCTCVLTGTGLQQVFAACLKISWHRSDRASHWYIEQGWWRLIHQSECVWLSTLDAVSLVSVSFEMGSLVDFVLFPFFSCFLCTDCLLVACLSLI